MPVGGGLYLSDLKSLIMLPVYSFDCVRKANMPTLSVHGDIHIPDNLIQALGLKPGVDLSFERLGDAIVMRPVKHDTVSRVEEGPKILAYSGATVTLEEMDAAIAKGAAQSL